MTKYVLLYIHTTTQHELFHFPSFFERKKKSKRAAILLAALLLLPTLETTQKQ